MGIPAESGREGREWEVGRECEGGYESGAQGGHLANFEIHLCSQNLRRGCVSISRAQI